MEKNEIFETAKNMAIEQVLNMYCSKDDPTCAALNNFQKTYLNASCSQKDQFILQKIKMRKAMAFMRENSQLLLVANCYSESALALIIDGYHCEIKKTAKHFLRQRKQMRI